MKNTIGLILLVFSSFVGFGQDSTKVWIEKYIASNGSDQVALAALQNYPNGKSVASEIWKIASDTVKAPDRQVVNLIKSLAKKNKDKTLQESYCRSLSEIALQSKNEVSVHALKALRNFAVSSFDDLAKENLEVIALLRKTGRQEAILLLGFIGGSDAIEYIKSISKFYPLSKQDKFASTLALVRLNDPNTVDLFMSDLLQKRVDNNLVYGLLPDLIYTQNKKVYDFLLTELDNPTPACSSANNDSNEKILCIYRILEQIADQIVDFPVKTNGHKELEGDYQEALQLAKDWYKKTEGIYSINSTKY